MKKDNRYTGNTEPSAKMPSRSCTAFRTHPGTEAVPAEAPSDAAAEDFIFTGLRPSEAENPDSSGKKHAKKRQRKSFPLPSVILLSVISAGCLFIPLITAGDPSAMDLSSPSVPPDSVHLFGTDTLGRDIFSMIWSGGRISLTIGFLSSAVSALTAAVLGSVSGLAPRHLDSLLMRFTDLFLSIPGLLLTVLLQAVLGEATVFSLSLVIGLTGWPAMARVIRTEVLRLRASDYVTASRTAGGGFFHILCRHLIPGFLPSVIFMAVMNIRTAVASESTLSFMGLGLPLETVSWGSMLSLAQQALTTSAWWIVLIPGLFLVVTLLCITDIGNCLRKSTDRRHSNL